MKEEIKTYKVSDCDLIGVCIYMMYAYTHTSVYTDSLRVCVYVAPAS